MLDFEVAAYSGDTRSTLLTLSREIHTGNFENIETELAEADEKLKLAHNTQTNVLADEAAGKELELNLFLFMVRII